VGPPKGEKTSQGSYQSWRTGKSEKQEDFSIHSTRTAARLPEEISALAKQKIRSVNAPVPGKGVSMNSGQRVTLFYTLVGLSRKRRVRKDPGNPWKLGKGQDAALMKKVMKRNRLSLP